MQNTHEHENDTAATTATRTVATTIDERADDTRAEPAANGRGTLRPRAPALCACIPTDPPPV
jgi:hypothetical protein